MNKAQTTACDIAIVVKISEDSVLLYVYLHILTTRCRLNFVISVELCKIHALFTDNESCETNAGMCELRLVLNHSHGCMLVKNVKMY